MQPIVPFLLFPPKIAYLCHLSRFSRSLILLSTPSHTNILANCSSQNKTVSNNQFFGNKKLISSFFDVSQSQQMFCFRLSYLNNKQQLSNCNRLGQNLFLLSTSKRKRQLKNRTIKQSKSVL